MKTAWFAWIILAATATFAQTAAAPNNAPHNAPHLNPDLAAEKARGRLGFAHDSR
jgi:hypothetical protein